MERKRLILLIAVSWSAFGCAFLVKGTLVPILVAIWLGTVFIAAASEASERIQRKKFQV